MNIPTDWTGPYTDESGCYFETLQDYLGSILGFCGCGRPDQALKQVHIALESIVIPYPNHAASWNGPEWQRFHQLRHWVINNLLGGEGPAYIMWYLLADKGFTEHGSSVPGWLTKDGKALLNLLRLASQTEYDS